MRARISVITPPVDKVMTQAAVALVVFPVISIIPFFAWQ